jgi:hypothetical protein
VGRTCIGVPVRLVVAPSRQYGQKSIGTQGFLIRCKTTSHEHTRCTKGVLLCRPTTLCLPLPEPAQSPRCFCLLTHYSNPIGVLSALLPTMGKSVPTCHQRCRRSGRQGRFTLAALAAHTAGFTPSAVGCKVCCDYLPCF